MQYQNEHHRQENIICNWTGKAFTLQLLYNSIDILHNNRHKGDVVKTH